LYVGVMNSQNYETHNLIKKNWNSLLGIFASLSLAQKQPRHKRISKGHELTMKNLGLVLSPNHGTQNVQNVCSNMFLSWRHERIITWLWCKIVSKIGVEQNKGNMRGFSFIYALLKT
jgi:hypothetical protein